MQLYQEYAILESNRVFALLESNTDGLSGKEAEKRIVIHGANTIIGKITRWWQIILRQFRSAFIYLLLVAALISFFLGDSKLDASLIFIFLLLNAVLGFFQEYRAENSLELLKGYVDRKTRVRRDGKEQLISVKDIVPGDLIILDAGDMIPADGYFIKAEEVTVDESPMTGETKPIPKTCGALPQVPQDFYAATNIGFSRTTLLSGDAELVVFATGIRTEVGAIADTMQHADSPSAFEEGISRFSKFILKLVLATIPIVFLLNFLIHHDTINIPEFLLFSIALTVSVIPEALPLVTTLSLSRGALLLAKKHVVPRRLSAIEDLGSIDVLCTDKTGTITENKLAVSGVWGEHDQVLYYALMSPLSLPDANSKQNSVFDRAIKTYVNDSLASQLHGIVRIDERPFDPVRRKGSVLVQHNNKRYLVVRGAPEDVCDTSQYTNEMRAWVSEQGSKGSRVLAIAIKEVFDFDKKNIELTDEMSPTLIGLLAFSDPLKPTAKHAIREAGRLGVHVKIITGDSKEVAAWVGIEAGIINGVDGVITGEELLAMSREEQLVAVERYGVFARTMPLQKYAIIELLQQKHLVGFLGEGFNDAPALKMAHVGLAVENASDIAQDASDVVLLNKSLDVIIDGIKEGRVIFANSMKYLRATLASNFGNFYALALSSLFIPYLPMLPIQVLLLNLLSDFPMISISTDNVDDEELKSPRGYKVSELTSIAIVLGVVSTIFDFAFFGLFAQFNDEKVLQTMWFIGSILTELIVLFSIRTTLPFWRAKRPSFTVVALTGVMALVTILLPYFTFAQRIFSFERPTPEYLFAAVALILTYFFANEVIKLLFYKLWNEKGTQVAGVEAVH